MKHRLRSKSWLCFQAKSGDDAHDSNINVYVKDGMQFPSVSSENSLSKMSMSSKSSTRSRRRSSSRRTFSRIVKAVFFEASLKKSKKVGQDPYQSLRSLPSKNQQQQKEEESVDSQNLKDSGNTVSNSSNSSSSSSNSCSSSSSSSNLSNLTEQRKSFQTISLEYQESTQKRNRYSSINGLCLLVIALMVLVFWGRICAIVCTSTWIYFGSFRLKKQDQVTVMNSKRQQQQHEEMESKEYKKRVIMGGFLERKHSRI